METSEALMNELTQIVGQSGLLSDAETSDYSYDGKIPKTIVLPASVGEIQEILQYASEKELSVMPAGAGTKLGIGNLANTTDIVLATTQLNKVVEYEPADLTVTIEAGMKLADLQNELAQHRQFLPLIPPYSDNCTIGGIVATNASGPLRLRYGTSRNLVLGMHVVQASGTVVKSGGKVVKNVAGYDLNKLYIGSSGTLGIITEVTLKLAPLPAKEAIIVAQFQNIQDVVKTGLNIVSSQLLPTYVNLLDGDQFELFEEKKPTLIIGYGGDPETVSWQIKTTHSLLEQNNTIGVHIIDEEMNQSIKNALWEFPAVGKKSTDVLVRVNLKRTDLANFAEQTQIDIGEMMALIGNGVLYLKIHTDSDTDYQQLANALSQLRQLAEGVSGNLIIENAPPDLKDHIDVWGSIGNTLKLMKQVKGKFDKKHLLNPGRFISGI